MHSTQAAFIAALVLLVLGVAARPSAKRRLYFLPIFGLGIFMYRNRLEEAGAVPIGLLLAIASDYILLADVQREIRREKDLRAATGTGAAAAAAAGGGNVGNEVRPVRVQIWEKGLWERVKWSLSLLCSVRGVGWSHGRWAASCPAIYEGCTTRREFFQLRLKWLVLNTVLFLVAMAGIEKNPSFHKESTHFLRQSMLWKSWSMFLFIGASTPLLSMGLNIIPGMVAVALGLSEPEDWPFLFGDAGTAYTVRNFWGKTWHQLLRRPLISHGKFVTRTFGIRQNTEYAYAIQTISAFLLSGLIHTASLSDLRPLQFFLLQASGIILEALIIHYFKEATPAPRWLSRASWQRVGYVWVWTWFMHTLWPFWNAMADSEVFGRGFNILDLILRRGLTSSLSSAASVS